MLTLVFTLSLAGLTGGQSPEETPSAAGVGTVVVADRLELTSDQAPEPCFADVQLREVNGQVQFYGRMHEYQGRNHVWCYGAKHLVIGTVDNFSNQLSRVVSDAKEPLRFELVKGAGYVYRGGRGVVTRSDGSQLVLPPPAVSAPAPALVTAPVVTTPSTSLQPETPESPVSEETPSCFPTCRPEFRCRAGQCVSLCNPTCDEGETCDERGLCLDDSDAEQSESSVQEAQTTRRVQLGAAVGPALCVGLGCSDGYSGGEIGIGGNIEVWLGYRASPWLAFEVGPAFALHTSSIPTTPLVGTLLARAGPRAYLAPADRVVQPSVGLHGGYARTFLRWANATTVTQGLALDAMLGLEARPNDRFSLGIFATAVLPYWRSLCDNEPNSTQACFDRSELGPDDLRPVFFYADIGFTVAL